MATVTDKASATGATLKKVEYTYDAFDQRTAKRLDNDGNGTWDRYEVFVWADGQEVQRWVDTDGATATQKLRLSNRYLWADAVDQLLADEQYAAGAGFLIDATAPSAATGNTLWGLTDHLGSVRDLLDNNGVVREHNVYDSFGRLIREVDYNTSGAVIASNDAAAVDTIFGYTGRDFDLDTGLQYNRARWYDPQTGRWLSQDPIGFAAGDANLYRYVGNGATGATDPSGLIIETIWDAGNVFVGGYSFGSNIWNGNFGAAVVDAGGVCIDILGTATPFVPAGAAAAIKVTRESAEAAARAAAEKAAKEAAEKAVINAVKPRRITNPKHHPKSKSPEPANIDELYSSSIVDEDGVRWSIDSNGDIHRFSKPSNGETHWNGSTCGKQGIRLEDIPNDIRKKLKGK